MTPTGDRLVVRAVIGTLSLVALIALVAMVGLAATHRAIPSQIDRAFTFAIGAVSGVLAKTSTTPDPPQA